MRSVLGALTAVLILGAAGTASAQTFLSPGALKDGTRGYFGPGEPMALPAEGRSASTGMTRLWCDSGDILCYPVMFRDIADMSVF
ncbi:MAG TPA: hypothetical protein VFE89_04655 [Beijerinckiaceae bacterium]|jgi:hypothetical protein|nr:hypothetical protein [Beijerinckiaceae bacterium]